MPRANDLRTLSELLGGSQVGSPPPSRPRSVRAWRATANLSLALGVMAIAVSLGLLVGQLGRSLIGG